MLIGLVTGLHNKISVQDIGLTNQTETDGLAVGRPSGFAGKRVEPFLAGSYTVNDNQLFSVLGGLAQSENIKLERLLLPALLARHGKIKGKPMHLIWATGGNMVPNKIMKKYIEKGRTSPADCLKTDE